MKLFHLITTAQAEGAAPTSSPYPVRYVEHGLAASFFDLPALAKSRLPRGLGRVIARSDPDAHNFAPITSSILQLHS
jgi:hypothetical protein